MKTTSLFTYSTNTLVRLLTVNTNCLTSKIRKCACDPILETLLKMRPHDGQSGRENATPSSGTSPLASIRNRVQPSPLPLEQATSSSHWVNVVGIVHKLVHIERFSFDCVEK